LISGGVGTGKTVLLRALTSLIDKDQRIITIEDTAELSIDSHPNVVTLEGKAEECDATGQIITPAITARMLVKLAMRQRGDRLIVGECRGAEAWDLLKALNSGSSGSFTSIHADTAEMALEKLAMYTLEANTGMPMAAIYRNIGSAVHYVLQQERRPDGSRGVAELLGVERHNGESFEKQVLYRRQSSATKKAAA
jgi:pilus assembly protein CpaF